METSEGTNHEHASAETLGGKVHVAKLACNLSKALSSVLALAEERNERVGRVGDNGADNTGSVTRKESDTELLGLGVGVTGGSEDLGVEELNDLLEEIELGLGEVRTNTSR